MLDTLTVLFERELLQLEKELESYNTASNVWVSNESIKNSGGNLALHLTGNLQFFIGNIIGKNGYERNRKAEFEAKDIPLDALRADIAKTIADVKSALKNIDPELLQENYPIEVFGNPMTYEFFIMHLLSHLSYHIGQINYHRRMFDTK